MKFESAFLLSNPEQISNKLAILCKNKCLLNVSFGDDHNFSFITTILEVNKKNNNVIFYHGPSKTQIEKLFSSTNVVFETEHHGVKVSFSGNKIKRIRYNEIAAFTMPIPDALFWVEARDFHRVRIPLSNPSYCVLIQSGQEPVKLRLYDISLTGFSVLNDCNEISQVMNPNIYFKNCKLLLSDFNEGAVSFEIRHKFVIKHEYITRTEKIGCKFTEISQAFENIIQAYILQIEREYRQNPPAEFENRTHRHLAGHTLS